MKRGATRITTQSSSTMAAQPTTKCRIKHDSGRARALVQCQRSLGNYCYCNCELIHFGVETTSTTVRAHQRTKNSANKYVGNCSCRQIVCRDYHSFVVLPLRLAPLARAHLHTGSVQRAQLTSTGFLWPNSVRAVCMSPFDIVSMARLC